MSSADSIIKIIICVLSIIFWCMILSKISEKESSKRYILLGSIIIAGCVGYSFFGIGVHLLSSQEGMELLIVSVISVYSAKIDKSIRKRAIRVCIFPLVVLVVMCSNSAFREEALVAAVTALMILGFLCIAFAVGELSLKLNIEYSIYEESVLLGVLNWITYYIANIIINSVNNSGYQIRMSLVMLACAVVVVLYVNIYEHYASKMQNQMTHISYKQNEVNIKNIKKMNEDTSRIRHDLKNCIIAIKGYSDSQDYDGLSNYLDEYSSQQIKTSGLGVFCDNQIINFIINNKFILCKQQGIQTKCIIMGHINEISEVDLSILLGNLLDNAIEGTKGSDYPSVSVEIYCDGNESIIIVDNTIKVSVLKNNKELRTSKKDADNHGFGIMSIKSIAAKNNGEVSFSEIKNVFRSKIVMKSKMTIKKIMNDAIQN